MDPLGRRSGFWYLRWLALTLAWTEDGGQMIGLSSSAAAAAVLAEQTGIRTDTLAKLTWPLDHGNLPDWAATVGPSTLVIIDEAGMAHSGRFPGAGRGDRKLKTCPGAAHLADHRGLPNIKSSPVRRHLQQG